MQVCEDVWLSQFFPSPVYRVVAPGAETDYAFDPKSFYYCRVDCADINSARRIIRAGFYVVDTHLLFRYNGGENPGLLPEGVNIENFSTEYEQELLSIAREAFRFSRFHLDPEIPAETANRIKEAWVRNCAHKLRGERLFISTCGGKVAGFLSVIKSDMETDRSIDLIGVAEKYRNRGIASALIRAFIGEYGQSSTSLWVGTQAANIPSINLYEKMGFRLHSARYLFHRQPSTETCKAEPCASENTTLIKQL